MSHLTSCCFSWKFWKSIFAGPSCTDMGQRRNITNKTLNIKSQIIYNKSHLSNVPCSKMGYALQNNQNNAQLNIGKCTLISHHLTYLWSKQNEIVREYMPINATEYSDQRNAMQPRGVTWSLTAFSLELVHLLVR